jgi:hypothetical protein
MKIKNLSTVKKVLYCAAIAFLLLIIIVPGLRWIFWTLFAIAIVVGIVIGSIRLQKKTRARTAENLKQFPNQYPMVYNFFAVEKTPMATPLPNSILERTIWRALPAELRESEPTLSIAPNFVLSCSGVGFGKQYANAALLETGMINHSVLNALATMSEKLGIQYATIAKRLEKIETIAQNENKHLYYAPNTFTEVGFIKSQLQLICNAMNIDYDSAGLGEWKAGSSSYIGSGSWGMFGLGLALSAGSAMNAAGKNQGFNTASVYASFNNIVDYFNTAHYPEEYESWKAKQQPVKAKLSIARGAMVGGTPDSFGSDYTATPVKGLPAIDEDRIFSLVLFDFDHGVAEIWAGDNKGAVGIDGSVVVPLDYARLCFSDGIGTFQHRKNGKYGLMDASGKIILPEEYDGVGMYSDGLVSAKTGGAKGRWGYIDINGNQVIPPLYDDAGGFSDGFAVVAQKQKYGLIDKSGTLVVPYAYDELRAVSDGMVAAKSGKRWGFIDVHNNTVIPIEYGNVNGFSEGFAAVTKEIGEGYDVHNWGFIDKSGHLVIPYGYYSVGGFKNRLASVQFNKDDDETRFIDTSGTVAVSFPYHIHDSFDASGYVSAWKLDEIDVANVAIMHGIVNKNGEVIVPFIYDSIGSCNESGCVLAYSKKNRQFYVVGYRNASQSSASAPAAQKWEETPAVVAASQQTQILTKGDL